MKVSFDFDDTLSNKDVQAYAKHLISNGVDVWVTTSRGRTRALNPTWNDDLWAVVNKLNIPNSNVLFTEWEDKWSVLNNRGFIWHLDDDEIEIEQMALNNSDVIGVYTLGTLNWIEKCEKLLTNKDSGTDRYSGYI